MVYNQKIVYRYNSYATKKFFLYKNAYQDKNSRIIQITIIHGMWREKKIKYQLILAVKLTKELKKVEAYRTKKSQ